MQNESQNRNTGWVRVWDPLVRIFHWGVAAAFATAWLTEGDELMSVHSVAGYTVFGLVLVRLVWGFVGSRHARFADFVFGPGQVLGYLAQMKSRNAPRYIGHNPAGGVMVVMLLACLFATAIAGLLTYGADGHGPLVGLAAGLDEDMLKGIHELLAEFTLFLVVLHLIGVAYSSWEHRENLPRAMVIGIKRAEGEASTAPGRPNVGGAVVTGILALALVGAVAAAGYLFPEEEGDEQGEHHQAGDIHSDRRGRDHDEDEAEERREHGERR